MTSGEEGRAPIPPLTLAYTLSAIRLLLNRDIRWPTFRLALRDRPIAVCGRGSSFIIDDVEWERMNED
jgi:hypothetical protein